MGGVKFMVGEASLPEKPKKFHTGKHRINDTKILIYGVVVQCMEFYMAQWKPKIHTSE